ncbi:hypothetical protein [Arthrobacter celericrescens]|uniref:hypothetical protein n=1 Tax=Arthrobacter celericrescens TaxID=2320851 RepID=UPI000EA052F9|nr:hypothetical protein [Arthrobacter celericrescens]
MKLPGVISGVFGIALLLLALATPAHAADEGGLVGGAATADATKDVPQNKATDVVNQINVGDPEFIFRSQRICTSGDTNPLGIHCGWLNSRCTEKPGGYVVSWEYRRRDSPTWQLFQDNACVYPGDPTDRPAGPARPAFSITEFRSLPLKPAKIVTQPGRHTLKGAYTNVYAEVDDQGFSPRLAGKVISVRAHPSSFAWNYGDGTAKTLTIQGGPLRPDQAELDSETRTSHVYAGTGDYNISVTTTYTGEYSVDGGPWIPIIGTAQVNSPPVPMSVWRTETHLAAENCLENPQGWACAGTEETDTNGK